MWLMLGGWVGGIQERERVGKQTQSDEMDELGSCRLCVGSLGAVALRSGHWSLGEGAALDLPANRQLQGTDPVSVAWRQGSRVFASDE